MDRFIAEHSITLGVGLILSLAMFGAFKTGQAFLRSTISEQIHEYELKKLQLKTQSKLEMLCKHYCDTNGNMQLPEGLHFKDIVEYAYIMDESLKEQIPGLLSHDTYDELMPWPPRIDYAMPDEAARSPLDQFAIKSFLDMRLGSLYISFTNPAFFMLLTLGLVFLLFHLVTKKGGGKSVPNAWQSLVGFQRNGLHFLSFSLPAGVPLPLAPFLVLLELIPHSFRALSSGIRLFANMMAGHSSVKILSGSASWTMQRELAQYMPLLSMLIGGLLGDFWGGNLAFSYDGLDVPPTAQVTPHTTPPEIPLESSGSEWTWSLEGEGDSSVGGPDSPGWTTLLEEPNTSSSASSVHGQSPASSAAHTVVASNPQQLYQERMKVMNFVGSLYRHYVNRGRPRWRLLIDPKNEKNCAYNILVHGLEMGDSVSEYEELYANLMRDPSALDPLFEMYRQGFKFRSI